MFLSVNPLLLRDSMDLRGRKACVCTAAVDISIDFDPKKVYLLREQEQSGAASYLGLRDDDNVHSSNNSFNPR